MKGSLEVAKPLWEEELEWFGQQGSKWHIAHLESGDRPVKQNL
jgi:hypothetical protein